MLIGYARISTTDQTLALQQDALKAAGCDRIFSDTASGARADRLGLAEALTYVRAADTLVVWRLDRLGRSLAHLIQTVKQLQERGVHFRSLQEQLDTSTSGGKFVFHFFGAPDLRNRLVACALICVFVIELFPKTAESRPGVR